VKHVTKKNLNFFLIRISDSLTGLSLISSPVEEFGLLPGPVQARSIAAASLSRLQVGPGSHSCASKRKLKGDATFPPPPRLVASATAAPSPQPPAVDSSPLPTRGTIRAPRSRLLRSLLLVCAAVRLSCFSFRAGPPADVALAALS